VLRASWLVKTMDSIQNIFNKKKKQTPLGLQVEASDIIKKAEEVLLGFFGDEAAKSIKVLYFKNGALTLSCESSVLGAELRMYQGRILKKLNSEIGEGKVKKVLFRL